MINSEILSSKSNIFIISILLCTIILGAVLRFYTLDKKTFWEDEGAIIGCAKYNLQMYVHPPLYVRMISVILKVFGESQFIARLLSVFSGILFLPLIYIFCRDFYNRETAIYTTIFSSVSAYAVQSSQELRMYITSGLFTLGTIYFGWKFIEHAYKFSNGDVSKKHYFYLVFYKLFSLVGVYTMHSTFISMLVINLCYIIFIRWKFIWSWVIAHFIIILLYLPQLQTTLIQSRGYHAGVHLNYFNPLYFLSNLASFLTGYIFLPLQFTALNVINGSISMIMLYVLVTVITIISLFFGILYMKTDSLKLFFIVTNYLFPQIFFMSILLPPNHMVVLQPLLVSFILFGLLKLKKILFWTVFIILISLNVIALDKYYEDDQYIFYPEDWKKIVEIIEEKEEPGDSVYIGGNRNGLFTFRYYYKGSLDSRTYLEEKDLYVLQKNFRRSRINVKEELMKTFFKSKRLWIVSLSNDPHLIPIIQNFKGKYSIEEYDIPETMKVVLVDKKKPLMIPLQH